MNEAPSDPPSTGLAQRSPLSPRRAVGRLSLALLAGGVAFLCVPDDGLAWWIHCVVGWDVAALVLLGLAWSIILRAGGEETERRASGDDPGRNAVSLIALASSMFSFFAAVVVLLQVKDLDRGHRITWTALTLLAIALSWLVTHTSYALRYAHMHYESVTPPGIRFPDEGKPADIDFAYFAFTIGMCFQVSDVVLCSTRFRRAVLWHALLSFVYNTAILALALNLASGR